MDPVSKAQRADSSGLTARQRANLNLHHYPPGTSGNPGGRKKKPFQEIIDRCMKKKANRDEISAVIMDVIRSRRMASVLMMKEVAERSDGPVPRIVEMDVSGTISLEQVLEAKKKAGK